MFDQINLYQQDLFNSPQMRRSLLSQQQLPQEQKAKNNQIVKQHLTSVQEKIFLQFIDGTIQICKPRQQSHEKKEKEQFHDKTYQKILHEKRRAEMRLSQIEKNEKQYLLKHQIKVDRNESLSRVKSQLNQQDIENLKKLYKAKSSFERSLQQKSKQYEINREKRIMQERQEKEKMQKELNEKKRKEIAKRIQQLQRKSKEREQKQNLENSEIGKLKSRKKLYEVLDESWKQKNEQEQYKKWQMMEHRFKAKEVQLHKLKEHEKKYEEVISQKKKQLHRRRNEARKFNRQTEMQISFSKFYRSVIEEDQRTKEMLQEKKQAKKLFRDKVQNYAGYVRSQHQPKQRTTSENSEDNFNQKVSRISKEDQHKMGLQNLKYGKSRAKKGYHKTIDLSFEETATKPKYKDYLAENRKQKEKVDYSSDYYEKPYQQAQKIMQNEKLQRKEKLAKVKVLSEKYDSPTLDIVKKVAGKLQILQIMS